MAGGLLGIATSALNTAQRQLAVTGHNIANVNTEGYSRQRVEQTERPPTYTGGTFVGNGVDIASITRAYDGFLDARVRTSVSNYNDVNAFHGMAAKVDDFIADTDASLSPSMQSFFKSAQEVANDPTSIAARQVMVGEGENLARRFNALNSRIDELRDQAYQSLPTVADDVSTLAKGIAELNTQIVTAYGQSQGDPPNDLLDQRDQLIRKISEKVDTTLVPEKDGAVNVFIGSGQPLVLRSAASKLEVRDSPYGTGGDPQFFLTVGKDEVNVTRNLTGGQIGGLVRFGKEILDPLQNGLGRIAAGLAVSFNGQHEAGTDLNGTAGAKFFTDPADAANLPFAARGHKDNTGDAAFSVAFANTPASGTNPANGPGQLTDSDYQLDFDGTQYTLTRLSDKTQFTSTDGSFAADGLNITLTGGAAAAGDRYLVRPTRTFAGAIAGKITDPRQIAAAGNPSGGPGDNTNALALGNLQSSKILLGGKATFSDAYTQIVGKVGTATHAADIDLAAQKQLMDSAIGDRDSLVGVNLDEEAANLMRFQQAYQASAQLISTSNSLFDSLISAVRS